MTGLRHLLTGLCCVLGALCITLGWYVLPLFWGISWWWAPLIAGAGVLCLWLMEWLDETK